MIHIDNAVFPGRRGRARGGAFAICSAASQADDRIVYHSAPGALWFDADGNGAARRSSSLPSPEDSR